MVMFNGNGASLIESPHGMLPFFHIIFVMQNLKCNKLVNVSYGCHLF